MKTVDSINICNIGAVESIGTNCGKKARKKIESLGLKMFIRNPLKMICWALFSFDESSNFIEPVSRHIVQARYNRYATPTNLSVWNARALAWKMAANPNELANRWGMIPEVQPMATAILARQPRKSPVETV